MRRHNTNRWGIAVAVMALMLAWTGSALAEDRDEPPAQDDARKPPSAAEFIERLDKDKDGKVSKDEFDGPAEHFADLDKNEDGYISEDEAPTGPPCRQGRRGGRGGEQGERR